MNYPESLLQWIWGTLQFDPRSIRTTEGLELQIISPGILNCSDGPDYKHACCRIDGLKWYGSIEIHWKSSDWYRHDHHRNPAYDNVFLHIVIEDNMQVPVQTFHGHKPHTLNLGSYINEPLKTLFKRFDTPGLLPCAPYIGACSSNIFKKQLDKANKAYFEKKVELLMREYPSELPLSKAWYAMVTIGLFDGLGILHNRAPMRQLAEHILYKNRATLFSDNEDSFIKWVDGLAFGKGNSWSRQWHTKSCRPANHPVNRVKQAAGLYFYLSRTTFRDWLSLHNDPAELWKDILRRARYRPGKQRAAVLYTTVLLPAIYILGQLTHSTAKKNWAYNAWRQGGLRIPKSIEKVYKDAGIESDYILYNPGAIYQKKAYCDQRQCNNCEVLKSAVYS